MSSTNNLRATAKPFVPPNIAGPSEPRPSITPANPPARPEKKVYLSDVIGGVAIATLNSKSLVDLRASEIRKEVYEKNEFLKSLPLSTFNISDVEVDLKFVITDVEKTDKDTQVVINTDVEKLASLSVTQSSISTVRFKIISKPLVEYQVGEARIFKEE